jgi:hypothetical protein
MLAILMLLLGSFFLEAIFATLLSANNYTDPSIKLS